MGKKVEVVATKIDASPTVRKCEVCCHDVPHTSVGHGQRCAAVHAGVIDSLPIKKVANNFLTSLLTREMLQMSRRITAEAVLIVEVENVSVIKLPVQLHE